MNYKIYIKGLLLFSLFILITTLLNSTLYYFDITNSLITKIIEIIILITSLFISGFYIGKNSQNKAYLNGLIFSSILIIINILLNLIINKKITLILIVYYLLITIITTTSSIIGINKKK